MKFLISFIITGFSMMAVADQCAVIDRAQAEAFTKMVNIGDQVGFLCEPCGETTTEIGSVPQTEVQSISVQPFSLPRPSNPDDYIDASERDFVTVAINDQTVDLAYTYINTTRHDWYSVSINAAFLVGCHAEGVTPQIVGGE